MRLCELSYHTSINIQNSKNHGQLICVGRYLLRIGKKFAKLLDRDLLNRIKILEDRVKEYEMFRYTP